MLRDESDVRVNRHASVTKCPGGCALPIPRRVFCCADCWERLPVEIRDRLDRALRGRPGDGGYTEAVRSAVSWLADNPTTGAIDNHA